MLLAIENSYLGNKLLVLEKCIANIYVLNERASNVFVPLKYPKPPVGLYILRSGETQISMLLQARCFHHQTNSFNNI